MNSSSLSPAPRAGASNTPVFFDAERQRFFRPLNSSRRELVAACLRALYDRLHGPAADYAHHLTRDVLRELLLPVVRQYQTTLADDGSDDEFSAVDASDPQLLVAMVIRALVADGWLEQFADRTGLVAAFRFSRPGKLFSEALWALDRPSRSRQRNMRGCRNALEAALSERGDAHDLVDAYEYAEKVIEDLADGIDYFQELVRHLMQAASAHTQWNEFVDFLDRFQRDYSKQLTADNATLNRQAIRQKLEKLRAVPEAKFNRMDAQLRDIAHWMAKEYTGSSLYDWLLGRIEDRDSEQLRDTARGLTKDGKGSGSRTMFVGERRDLVLGRKAREQALRATIEKLDAADRGIREFEQLQDTLSSVKRLLGNLREPVFDAMPLGQAAGEIDSTRRSLAQLDLTEVEQLRAERAKLELLIAGHDAEITAVNKEITLASQRITDAQGAIERINGGRDARFREREDQIRRLGQMCETNSEKTYTVIAEEVEGLLKSRRFDVHSVQVRLNTLRAQPDKLLGDVREMLAEYNANARQEERFQSALPHLHDATMFDPYYGPLVALGRAVGALHSELEGIGLYNNRAKVEEAERSFHDVFTKQFCVEIKSKVDDGVRLLRQLNMELERLKFGTDRFSIDWSKWEPEFQEYYSFFSAVTDLADSVETVDLFGETELTPKHVEVRDRLVKLLLDSDQERAGRELLRIADYRNYRRYEIWNDSDSGGRIALSTWGTGSGGQLETPAYIVRAAVVTNRLKFFEKGPSLKMLVSDESFSTMDEPRARAVLQYLRESLDIQVISAMPTRGAGGLRPEFDREYSYSRVPVDANGELDFILEYDERIFKKDKMRELWEKQRAAARAQAELAFGAAEAAQQAEALK